MVFKAKKAVAPQPQAVPEAPVHVVEPVKVEIEPQQLVHDANRAFAERNNPTRFEHDNGKFWRVHYVRDAATTPESIKDLVNKL